MLRREAQGWAAPENLASLNTPGDEGWPFLSEDGAELWFTRTCQGSPAIYRTIWDGAAWSAPELVISQFAGEPSLDRAGNLYFVHHHYRDGQPLGADIYVAVRRR